LTTVAVIGLGIMGGPMAANLVKAGYDVIGYNRNQSKIARLVEQGGRGAADVTEAARDADVVLTVLPDSPDVEEVVLGKGGVLESAEPGTLLIDGSTIRPEVSVRVAEAAGQRGLRAVDAPVSGGEPAAIEGTLSIMVGGEEADVAAARPVLEAVGSIVVHVARPGQGRPARPPTS
jgi:2-hydroxy-3-oxopropionate reductase